MNDAQRAVLRYFDDARQLRSLLWMRGGVRRRMTPSRESALRFYAGRVIAWGVR